MVLPTAVRAQWRESGEATANDTLGAHTEEGIVVKEIRVHEDVLLLDGTAYRVTAESRAFGEEGGEVSLRALPGSGTVDVRYVRRRESEEHPQGGGVPVLLELRFRSAPGKGGAP